jgi:hypothetical protein
MRHPSGKLIQHNKINHSYFIKGEDYNFTSVTQILKKFFPKFEAEKVAKKYAKKHSLDWKEVRQGWKTLGRESSIRGKKYHKFSEEVYKKYIKGDYNNRISGFGKDSIEKKMEKILLNLYNKYTPLPPETIVGSLALEIAGSTDLIMALNYFSKERNRLLIADWKFVKEIKYSNTWEKAYYPIQYLDNCNYYQYCLQLNLYSYIIKKEKYFPNYPVHDLRLFHVSETDICDIEVPNMQQDVRNILIEFESLKEKRMYG